MSGEDTTLTTWKNMLGIAKERQDLAFEAVMASIARELQTGHPLLPVPYMAWAHHDVEEANSREMHSWVCRCKDAADLERDYLKWRAEQRRK